MSSPEVERGDCTGGRGKDETRKSQQEIPVHAAVQLEIRESGDTTPACCTGKSAEVIDSKGWIFVGRQKVKDSRAAKK
ncbi:MAG TPA: hypothetical protein VK525_11075 [Candidatus Saccharimonadales bacterium]|jgi:hypothetical protein|nr:hypothetical protein [Candidatus Saccharimonadales bacterium]